MFLTYVILALIVFTMVKRIVQAVKTKITVTYGLHYCCFRFAFSFWFR